MLMLCRIGCALALGVFVAGCSATAKPQTSTQVSKASFEAQGRSWPLSVTAGSVGCTHGNELWFEVRGKRYGLNDQASKARGYAALESIWLSETSDNGASQGTGSSDLEFLTASRLANGSALLTELAQAGCAAA